MLFRHKRCSWWLFWRLLLALLLALLQKQPLEMFCQKRCSLKFCRIHRKIRVPESLFNKVAGLRPQASVILLKKRLFPWILQHIKDELFYRTPPDDCFCYCNIKYTTIKYTIKNFLFLGNKCVILLKGYKTVCLPKNVLKTALSALNDLRSDNLTDTSNCAYRYDGYKQYTWWVHNNLGKGIRKVIPSCAVWAIRNNYPSKDGKYIRFMESEEGENRIIEQNWICFLSSNENEHNLKAFQKQSPWDALKKRYCENMQQIYRSTHTEVRFQ